MANAKTGDTVKVHYTGRLEDGTVFDSSEGRDPLEFILGQGTVIPGFEAAIMDMEVGGKKTETIVSDNAYGPYQDKLVEEVERGMIPDHIELDVGQHLQISRPDAPPLVLTVLEIREETIMLDANHPLAGKTLVFDIELVGIAE